MNSVTIVGQVECVFVADLVRTDGSYRLGSPFNVDTDGHAKRHVLTVFMPSEQAMSRAISMIDQD